ncbi:GAF domain-containing protein [Methanobacterium sp. CWC-01]|jgi:GAF domain-containing protein|uniref:GAF domain-containing protein n=1 Tax=Methanobacterium aridiramus TaxID=2584467 RepID=UPI002575DD24|nr:GAF domain-containing protein [Methanobacterium sp. CWC-01]WJI09532.1 GAF domain-containing protein [Methanobacterium sp. CWC-01]
MKGRIQKEKHVEIEVQEKLDYLKSRVKDLSPDSSLKEVSDLFLEVVTQLTHSPHGYMAFVDPKNGDSVGISFSHLTDSCQIYEKIGEARFKVLNDGSYGGLLGYSLDTGQSIYTNDPAHHPAAHGLPPLHEPVARFLSVPVLDGEEVLGQIVLGNSAVDYDKSQVRIAEQVAELYALVLKKLL